MSDLIESITALAREGKTSKQIGAALGCSKNAVIGRLHRAGISLGDLNGHAQRPSQRPGLRRPDASWRGRWNRYNVRFRVEAVALSLLTSQARAAARLGCSCPAITNWARTPAIRTAAEAVAARCREEYARRSEDSRVAAERARVADAYRRELHNNLAVYNRLDLRRATIALRYANGETLEAIALTFGVTRERIRQLLQPAIALGLQVDPRCKARWTRS